MTFLVFMYTDSKAGFTYSSGVDTDPDWAPFINYNIPNMQHEYFSIHLVHVYELQNYVNCHNPIFVLLEMIKNVV